MSKETDTPVYDVDYFIQKFESIPEDKWTTLTFSNGEKCCALGHCGERGDEGHVRASTEEGRALSSIFNEANMGITLVNDWQNAYPKVKANNPRQRVLNALYLIKELQTNA